MPSDRLYVLETDTTTVKGGQQLTTQTPGDATQTTNQGARTDLQSAARAIEIDFEVAIFNNRTGASGSVTLECA